MDNKLKLDFERVRLRLLTKIPERPPVKTVDELITFVDTLDKDDCDCLMNIIGCFLFQNEKIKGKKIRKLFGFKY